MAYFMIVRGLGILVPGKGKPSSIPSPMTLGSSLFSGMVTIEGRPPSIASPMMDGSPLFSHLFYREAQLLRIHAD